MVARATTTRPHIAAWRRPEAKFSALMALAAPMFVAATLTAFLLLTPAAFAEFSVALTVGTMLAAVLQFGATLHIPKHVRRTGNGVTIPVTTHITVAFTLFGAVLLIILTIGLWPSLDAGYDWAFLLSVIIACHIIFDTSLRVEQQLVSIGVLSLILNAGFAVSIFALLWTGLDDPAYLLSAFAAARLAFCAIALALIDRRAGFPILQSIRFLPEASGGAAIGITAYALGSIDLVLLSALADRDTLASYISVKHFAYGVYIVLVQEGAIPVLVAKTVHSTQFRAGVVYVATVMVGITTSIVAMIVAAMLLLLKFDGFVNQSNIIITIGLGVGLHSMAVFIVNFVFITTYLSKAFYIKLLSSIILFGLLIFSLDVDAVVACASVWLMANALVILGFAGVYESSRRRVPIHSQRLSPEDRPAPPASSFVEPTPGRNVR